MDQYISERKEFYRQDRKEFGEKEFPADILEFLQEHGILDSVLDNVSQKLVERDILSIKSLAGLRLFAK